MSLGGVLKVTAFFGKYCLSNFEVLVQILFSMGNHFMFQIFKP